MTTHIAFATFFFIFQISACGCNTQGSNGNSCSPNGVCSCKANIIGSKCDSCAAGYSNFPTCQGQGKEFCQSQKIF